MKKNIFFSIFILVSFYLNFYYQEEKLDYEMFESNYCFQGVENDIYCAKKDKDYLNKIIVNTKISENISPVEYVLCRNNYDK